MVVSTLWFPLCTPILQNGRLQWLVLQNGMTHSAEWLHSLLWCSRPQPILQNGCPICRTNLFAKPFCRMVNPFCRMVVWRPILQNGTPILQNGTFSTLVVTYTVFRIQPFCSSCVTVNKSHEAQSSPTCCALGLAGQVVHAGWRSIRTRAGRTAPPVLPLARRS